MMRVDPVELWTPDGLPMWTWQRGYISKPQAAGLPPFKVWYQLVAAVGPASMAARSVAMWLPGPNLTTAFRIGDLAEVHEKGPDDWSRAVTCWPSATTVAGRMSCNERTVRRAIGELVDAHWLHVKTRKGTTSRYTIVVPPCEPRTLCPGSRTAKADSPPDSVSGGGPDSVSTTPDSVSTTPDTESDELSSKNSAFNSLHSKLTTDTSAGAGETSKENSLRTSKIQSRPVVTDAHLRAAAAELKARNLDHRDVAQVKQRAASIALVESRGAA